MNHLITTATGELISSTILDIPNPGAGRSVVVRPDGEQSGIWNTSTLEFDEREKVVNITKDEFINRLTDAEMMDIIDAGPIDPKVRLLLEKLRIVSRIEISSLSMKGVLDYLEDEGLIAEGRAQAIIDG